MFVALKLKDKIRIFLLNGTMCTLVTASIETSCHRLM